MSGLLSFFISPAFAQAAEQIPPANDVPSILMRYLPVTLIFVVFYLFLIRPQQKKFEEQSKLISNLKKGDKVVVLGGIVGVIAKLEGDDYLLIDLGSGAQMKVLRNAVTALDEPKGETKDDKKQDKKKA